MSYSDVCNVDRARCCKCEICVNACPVHMLDVDERNYPVMPEENAEYCGACGHCVAACPKGVFYNKYVPIEKCPPIKKELEISYEQAVQFLRSRRTIRNFDKKPLSKEEITELIELARYAPTGGNMECVEWSVISDKNIAQRISELTIKYFRDVVKKDPEATEFRLAVENWDNGEDYIFWNSPTVITAMAPPFDPTGRINLTIALTYLDLIVHAKGLGACWAGLINFALPHVPELKKLMKIPDDYDNYYSIIVGYKQNTEKFYRLPERKYPVIKFSE